MPKGRGIMIEELFFRLDSTQQHIWCYLFYLVNSHQEFVSDLEGFCEVLQSMLNHSISQGPKSKVQRENSACAFRYEERQVGLVHSKY